MSAYTNLLADHRRLPRPAFQALGGAEMQHTGDGLVYNFPSLCLNAFMARGLIVSVLEEGIPERYRRESRRRNRGWPGHWPAIVIRLAAEGADVV